MNRRLELMQAAFTDLFGGDATHGVRAPGRVDLMGSHTDYNDGYVLTLPLDLDCWMIARPRDDGQVRLASMNLPGTESFSSKAPCDTPLAGWGRYVQGVAGELCDSGRPITACDILIHSTVPVASGLSSSAALEVASATLFEALGGFGLAPLEKAQLCQGAENRWVGVNCGILDQYTSVLGEAGHALLLDCRNLSHEAVELPRGMSIVIGNTRAPRELENSAYDERRRECERAALHCAPSPGAHQVSPALRDVSRETFLQRRPGLDETAARRADFIISENQRVLALAGALGTGDRSQIGQLMAGSFAGARDDYEITTREMIAMMEAMSRAPGFIGGRQAGAGFGGCMVAMVASDAAQDFMDFVAPRYESSTGILPEMIPAHSSEGAGVIHMSAPASP